LLARKNVYRFANESIQKQNTTNFLCILRFLCAKTVPIKIAVQNRNCERLILLFPSYCYYLPHHTSNIHCKGMALGL
jgi:hypothetical protein